MGISFIVKQGGSWSQKFDATWWDSGQPSQAGNAAYRLGPPPYWERSSGGTFFGLVAEPSGHGSWWVDYRPTQWRMEVESTGNLGEIWLYDSGINIIAHVADYTSLDPVDITFQGLDLKWILCGNFLQKIYNIEFFEE